MNNHDWMNEFSQASIEKLINMISDVLGKEAASPLEAVEALSFIILSTMIKARETLGDLDKRMMFKGLGELHESMRSRLGGMLDVARQMRIGHMDS